MRLRRLLRQTVTQSERHCDSFRGRSWARNVMLSPVTADQQHRGRPGCGSQYHATFSRRGFPSNSYTNNECLTWLNPALTKTNQERDERDHLHHRRAVGEFLAKEENQGFSVPVNFGAISQRAPAILPIRWQSWVSAPVCLAAWQRRIWRDEYCAAGERRRQRQGHRYAAESDSPVAPSSAIVIGAQRDFILICLTSALRSADRRPH